MYDFVVVGAGVAGLAISELLQRSGRSVLLLERAGRVFAGASGDQQGWFHTGALYAPLPNSSFFRILVGNLDDLFDYYACFENMNLRVERTIYTSRKQGWFSNSTNFLAYVSPSAGEVSWPMKLPWWVAIRRAQRRLAWFEKLDFRRELSDQVRAIERRVPVQVVRRDGDFGLNLGEISRVLKSRDRTFDLNLIAADLLRSYLGHGGDLRFNARVKRTEASGVEVDEADGLRRYRARHVIVTAGAMSDDIVPGVRLRVVRSPLAVIYPAVAAMNFVRVTPRMDETINHLFHKYEDVEYSVVGNAVYYDASDTGTREKAYESMHQRMRRLFPGAFGDANVAMYDGTKTEVVGVGQLRNYQYHIVDSAGVTLALPGKASLGFSLAVNVCRHFGIEPLRGLEKLSDDPAIEGLVTPQRHYLLAQDLRSRMLS